MTNLLYMVIFSMGTLLHSLKSCLSLNAKWELHLKKNTISHCIDVFA